MSLLIPVIELGIAVWGSTWGWNLDGRMLEQAPLYILTSYNIFLAPQVVLRATPIGSYLGRTVAILTRKSAWTLLWGIFITGASVLLVHTFTSNALWLGSMGSLYLGLVVVVLAGIRLLV